MTAAARALLFLTPALLAAQPVEPVRVAEVPTYTEGVVVDGEGNFYVSHADRISRITPDGEVTHWATTVSPNGHKIRPDGNHIVCDRRGAVYLLNPDGVVIDRLASPEWGANDVTLDPDNGGFYFTSPYQSRTASLGKLYYVDSAGEMHEVADELGFPNGLVLRPDGRTLLVGESLYNRILEFPVEAPGRVGEPRIFAELPEPGPDQLDAKPDGMALDEAGNLYVAHYGMGQVQVLSPDGELLRSLRTGAIFTSNVAFAGDRLYVTGSVGPTEQTTGVLVRLELGR